MKDVTLLWSLVNVIKVKKNRLSFVSMLKKKTENNNIDIIFIQNFY